MSDQNTTGSPSAPVDLSGQVAVVTGGGRGIGRAIAQELAKAGAAVTVTARSQDQLEETVSLIKQAGGRALAVPADVADRHAVEQVVQETEQRLGPIDLLVNNAAVIYIEAIWKADPDEWWRTVEINLRGPFLCTRAVLPGMIERRRGRIINVTSGTSTTDTPYGSAYVASKAGLNRFTSSLAREVREHGIVAFTVAPGGINTAMQQYLREVPSPEWQRLRERARTSATSTPSFLPAERPAQLVAALASGAADALTGRLISVQDDLNDLIRRTEEIIQQDLYTVRVRK
jgi:NAD(P)-dependent dehydrogenase (short-subunit alcohol dehydrogenase family)